MYENVNFPGWEVVRKIGEGSFGGVYEIHRTLPDGRVEKAALKKLTVPKDNSEIRELYSQSFSRETITAHYKEQVRELAKEYTLTQELNSCKNVVACHDVQCVQHADGIGWDIYIRMELLKPLKLVLSADYQEMAVLKLGLSLCNALLACQEHHIVHRDIKPENILVSDRGEFKLGDFGIAKVSEKTATGTMTGTMGYMAPEVANRWHYGAQADIYSLGMVLYWMMNRRTLPFLPFPPTIPTAAQRQEAANRRFAGESFPPPVNGSRELKAIVMKACAFSTEERYQTVQELRRDLQAYCQQRRAGKKTDVSIPVSTDEAIWTSASTAGNTYSGSRNFHGSSQSEKTGRFAAPPKKKKQIPAAIRVLVVLCLCFAFLFVCLLMYSNRLRHQTVSTPETLSTLDIASAPGAVNRMRSDPVDEDADTIYDLQVFHSEALRKDVSSITFLDTTTDAPEDSWDISEDGDGSVLAWVTGQAPAYDLYIAGEGGVQAPRYCSYLFAGYLNATSITFGTAFDTSEVTGMDRMFSDCEKLTNLDVHNFDTSQVTNMTGMFSQCSELSSLDVTSFNTSLVFDMNEMFYGCSKLSSLDVNSFDTSQVTAMRGMFFGCSSLTDLDLRSFDTSQVASMSGMFSGCSNLTDLDLRSFDTSQVTSMWEMFSSCGKLKNLDVSSFDTSSVTTMDSMFLGCDSLTDLDLSSFDFSNVENYANFMDESRLYNGHLWTALFAEGGPLDISSRTQTTLAAGGYHTVGLRNDGTVVAAGKNSDGQCDVGDWENIVAVAAGWGHTVGLRSDGTVVAVGSDSDDQCSGVASWSDIVAVAAGWYHTVGLRSDGTVVTTEPNSDVGDWKDIVAVSAGGWLTLGLRSDGTVVATGLNGYGQCDVEDWKNIVAVAAGDRHAVGLCSDGTVVTVGDNCDSQCDVSSWEDIISVSAGESLTVGLRSDGTVVAIGLGLGQWDVGGQDIITVAAGGYHITSQRSDGTVVAAGDNSCGQCDISNWKNIRLPQEMWTGYQAAQQLMDEGKYMQAMRAFSALYYRDSAEKAREAESLYISNLPALAAGDVHTVGLRSDGSVVAGGSNAYAQCNVSSWTDIVAVAAGSYHTVGLHSDGTVVAAGQNSDGQCRVDNWTDIVAVAAGWAHTVGLRSNETVVAAGWNEYGQCGVDSWTDIVAVAAGANHTVGLRSDGTVVAAGRNDEGQCRVDGWTDIVAVAAGSYHTLGLRSDGTVVVVGWNKYGQCNVKSWTDIVALAAGYSHTVGLRSDGTVVAAGWNNPGQCNVSSWTNIAAVAAGQDHTIGLRSDGTVVATGRDNANQCDVSNWKNIRLPQ